MIERILEQKDGIRMVLGADRKSSHLVLTWQDLDVLESINCALSPLKDHTDVLSGEMHVTISALKPILSHLYTDVLAEDENETQLTKDIKRKIMAYLVKKYSVPALNELLDKATLIDPRFKATYVDSVDDVKDALTREAAEMSGTHSKEQLIDAEAEPEEQQPPSKKRKLSQILKRKNAGATPTDTSISQEEKAEHELCTFLQTPVIDVDENPLQWWKAHASTYPVLSQLVRKYFCVCASSSPSERVFSTSGNIVTDKRSCLKPDKINMLVVLAHNL